MVKLPAQTVLDPKLIVAISFLLLTFFFIIRSSLSSTTIDDQLTRVSVKSQNYPSTAACNKIPSSLSEAIIHYATTNITPQQTHNEISVTHRVLRRKSPCNFLVFGLGHDSPMWASLNHGGRTVFIEEDLSWIKQITKKFPTLESYHAVYNTKVRHSNQLLTAAREEKGCREVVNPRDSKCELALKGLRNEIYEVEWDLIMVDAPTGYHDEAPGRMSAIYTAGLMARNRRVGETDVFVHDVDRVVEDKFSMEFLCEGYMVEEEGRLRHFSVPSHRSSHEKNASCPSLSTSTQY